MNKTDLRDIKKIGVIVGNPGLGDLLFSYPLFSNIRRSFPGAEVYFIGNLRDYTKSLVLRSKNIDDIIYYEEYKVQKIPDDLLYFFLNYRKEKFDLVFDLQRHFLITSLTKFSGVKVFQSFSMKQVFSTFKADDTLRRKEHNALHHMRLLEPLGIKPELICEMDLLEIDFQRPKSFLRENNIDKFVSIVASSGYELKNWSGENYSQIIDFLYENFGFQSVLIGSKQDSAVLTKILNATKNAIILPDDFKIEETAALLRLSETTVGNDSGPLHLASFQNIPVIGLYGSTNPNLCGPLGKKSTVIRTNATCAPCSLYSCPYNKKCIDFISVEDVKEAISKILKLK
ncbi:glycosyltransferase family 9 protein [Thermodesulfobium sp. 4217-1]|uniref:glycosyltransferase family 9 protein n=1 Tax=Thermodesulfobium sp. 4217-1 TaxID=3120013 RepID=UPI0032215766